MTVNALLGAAAAYGAHRIVDGDGVRALAPARRGARGGAAPGARPVHGGA